MPKPTKGPRLGGSSSHQKALLANLATSLFEHGRIKTTEPKARALRPYAEKLITHAKKGTLHNRREVMKKIRDKDVVHTLFAEIGPFFADRDGGYTRIIKVEPRKGDNAPMAVIELVREKTVTSEANRARRSRSGGDIGSSAAASQAAKKAAPVAAAAAPQAAVEPEATVGPADEALAEEPTTQPEETVDEVKAEDAAIEEAQAAEAEAEETGDSDERSREEPTTARPTTPTSPSTMRRTSPPSIPMAGSFVFASTSPTTERISRDGPSRRGQRTVAGVLDDALSTVFRTPVRLRAAGRTDTGVHATRPGRARRRAGRCAAARPSAHPARRGSRSSCRSCGGSARLLPEDVRVLDIVRAPAGFDARFSALRRHYEYRLSTAPYGVEPAARRGYVTAWPRPLDVDAMAAASRDLLGLHDFAAFCRHRDGATTIRDLQRLDWARDGDLHHRPRQRRRVLLVDGAVAGGCVAGGRRGPPRRGLVRRPVDRDPPLQRVRGRACARD